MISPEVHQTPEPLENILEALMMAIEARDFKLRRHSERAAKYGGMIAAALKLEQAVQETLNLGALLHDIGNIGIPDSILLKPSGLLAWEFDEMKLHPLIGEQICRPILALEDALPLIRFHHEKLDGSGYPNGLSGDDIPTIVRILSVVDVYDTLRSERAYREAFGHAEAIDILRQEAERGWWDGAIVDTLAGLTAPQSDFAPV